MASSFFNSLSKRMYQKMNVIIEPSRNGTIIEYMCFCIDVDSSKNNLWFQKNRFWNSELLERHVRQQSKWCWVIFIELLCYTFIHCIIETDNNLRRILFSFSNIQSTNFYLFKLILMRLFYFDNRSHNSKL